METKFLEITQEDIDKAITTRKSLYEYDPCLHCAMAEAGSRLFGKRVNVSYDAVYVPNEDGGTEDVWMAVGDESEKLVSFVEAFDEGFPVEPVSVFLTKLTPRPYRYRLG